MLTIALAMTTPKKWGIPSVAKREVKKRKTKFKAVYDAMCHDKSDEKYSE